MPRSSGFPGAGTLGLYDRGGRSEGVARPELGAITRSVLPTYVLAIVSSACASDPPVSTVPQFEHAVMLLDTVDRAKVDRLAILAVQGSPGTQTGSVPTSDLGKDFSRLFSIADPGPGGGNMVGAGIGLLTIIIGAPIIAIKSAVSGADEEAVVSQIL